MSNIQYVTFVKDEFEMIAVFLALRSLQVLDFCEKQPIVLVPKSLAAELEEKHPKLKVQNMVRKLGGSVKDGFAKGFNPRNSFRASLGNLARKVGNEPMMYFAPTTIFAKNPEEEMVIGNVVAARSPDQYWPIRELYGPKNEDIWGEIAKFADVDFDKWVDQSIAKEYWRRYPCASTQLIYAKDAAAFSELYMATSKSLIEANMSVLQGQGRDLPEPTITAAIMKMGGQIANVAWDDTVIAYDNFPQLVLRMQSHNLDFFQNEILDFQGIRSTLKKIHEYKACLYHNALSNVREKFDDVERNFTLLRMNQLIERRKIDKKVKGIVREAKKAELEAKNAKKIEELASELAAKDLKSDAL